MVRKGTVRFHFIEIFALIGQKRLKETVADLLFREGRAFESMDYIFCSDEELLQINQEFLKHDDLTDIITFDLSDDPAVLKGEIYISVERVKDNAMIFNIPFHTELARVIFHGALHLCGYNDKGQKDQQLMRRKEEEYLAEWEGRRPRST